MEIRQGRIAGAKVVQLDQHATLTQGFENIQCLWLVI